MTIKKYAFLPLNKNASSMAVQNEFMVDYNNGELYINKGGPKLLSGENENEYINDIISSTMGLDDISMDDLAYTITQIMSYKNNILKSDGDIDDDLDFIYSIVSDLIIGSINLKDLVDSKVSGTGVLSDYNFNDTYVDKLKSIDKNANYYKHPDTPICDIRYVKSINSKTGMVEITSDDIGNLDVDPNANYYVHPTLPECDLTDNGVSFFNGQRGVISLNMKSLGLKNIKDMGLYNEVSQYLHLPTDYDGYSTPRSTSGLIDFFSVDLPYPVRGICSLTESKRELASDLHLVSMVGLFDDDTPFMYSNMKGYIDFNTISNAVQGTIGSITKSMVVGISNKGLIVNISGSIHYISMDLNSNIVIDKEHPILFNATPTDTGIFYIAGNKVVARPYKDYSKLGYSHETYAIRGGSYQHIANSIDENNRGIISIASDHEAYFAFADSFGVVRVVFINGANRYTHSGKGGMLYDL